MRAEVGRGGVGGLAERERLMILVGQGAQHGAGSKDSEITTQVETKSGNQESSLN